MSGPFAARTIVPFDPEDEAVMDAPVLDLPLSSPMPELLLPTQADADDPAAIARHLRDVGLVNDGEQVEIVTDAPPPVRQRVPAGRSRR